MLFQALAKYGVGLFATAALLFLPAGSFRYPGGWALLALLFGPMLILGAVLYFRAPRLLEKRLQNRERETTQKGVVALSGLLFVGAFVLAGLDFRFGWSAVPPWISVAAGALLLAAYAMYAEVMRENLWLSRVVEVQEGQKLVDTGLYAAVRHPMYTATLLLFLSIPLVLGSWPAFFVLLAYPVLLVARIRSEETLLERELPGYRDYKARVKYRLIPFLW